MDVGWPGGARAAVSLTFDDARASQLDAGLPILDRFGLKATFYVSPGVAERRLDAWSRVAAAGHEIGNHTMTHPCSANFPWSRDNALEDYTLARMEDEIDRADSWIRDRLGVAPASFAYPCGQTNVGRGEETRSYIPLVSRRFTAGRAFMAEVPNDPARGDLAALGAFESDRKDARWMRSWVERAKETGGWVIFCGHEVGADALQTTVARELEALCAGLADPAAEVWTATVADIAARVRRGAGHR